MKFIFISTLLLVSRFAFATGCVNGQTEITLTGVLTKSAVYMSQQDFPWAPANGFIEYPIFVTTTPVCFQDDGDFVDNVRVFQLVSETLPSDENLKAGVQVTIKGKVFSPMTAHHFGKLLLDAKSLTISN